MDNHLLVVSKPAGQLIQGDRTGDVDLLSDAKSFIKREFDKPGAVYVGLVHRIDRPASGVVVLARTSKAASRLSDQFRNRSVSKHYVALVEGNLRGSGHCVGHIAKIDERPKLVGPNTTGAKEARLSWRAMPAFSGRSIVDVDLDTGRAHQIRLQLADLGHPIVGDLRHGAKSEFDGRNLALHAYRIRFDHPTQKTPVVVVDLPNHWDSGTRRLIDEFLTSV